MTMTFLVAAQSNIYPGPNLPGQVNPGIGLGTTHFAERVPAWDPRVGDGVKSGGGRRCLVESLVM
jgi:hypothetical protein